MRRVVVGIVVLAVVAAAVYLILGRGRAARQASQESDQALPPVKASTDVVAEGRVVPVRGVTLGAASGGAVAEVLVREGDRVGQGQILVRFEAARADLEAARSEQAAAAAQAASARQQLSLVEAGARREEVEAASAEVRRARVQLDLLLSGPRAETIAAAEADVALASAALKQSRAALDQAEIRSPLDGTVAWVGPRPGEFVAPGAPVVRVGDLSAWQVETTDLTELSIVNVGTGNRARITVDGIPGLELTGRVIQIKSFGESRLGDITYTVVIAMDSQDERLRWNMTATVTIGPK